MHMKTLIPMPLRFISTSIRSLLRPFQPGEIPPEAVAGGRGESLLRLYEAQHRAIVGVFRANIVGYAAFVVMLLAFCLFTFNDPLAPQWLGYVLVGVTAVLAVGLYRMVREFRVYRSNYAEMALLLRDKLRQQATRGGGSPQQRNLENRLLSVLKPKEYEGWDAKRCTNCNKSIEMQAEVCQHCGHEQGSLLVN